MEYRAKYEELLEVIDIDVIHNLEKFKEWLVNNEIKHPIAKGELIYKFKESMKHTEGSYTNFDFVNHAEIYEYIRINEELDYKDRIVILTHELGHGIFEQDVITHCFKDGIKSYIVGYADDNNISGKYVTRLNKLVEQFFRGFIKKVLYADINYSVKGLIDKLSKAVKLVRKACERESKWWTNKPIDLIYDDAASNTSDYSKLRGKDWNTTSRFRISTVISNDGGNGNYSTNVSINTVTSGGSGGSIYIT